MNLPHSFVKIQLEETTGTGTADNPSAISESIFERIGGTINQILDFMQPSAVGDVEVSVLTEAQFQAVKGTSWILADGRDVTGSDFATVTSKTNVPDHRGQFTRGHDGTLPPNTINAPQIPTHSHSINWDNIPGEKVMGVNTNLMEDGGSDRYSGYPIPQNLLGFETNSAETTGNETRPRNECFNVFIKINED